MSVGGLGKRAVLPQSRPVRFSSRLHFSFSHHPLEQAKGSAEKIPGRRLEREKKTGKERRKSTQFTVDPLVSGRRHCRVTR